MEITFEEWSIVSEDGKDTNTAAKMLFRTCNVKYRKFKKRIIKYS